MSLGTAIGTARKIAVLGTAVVALLAVPGAPTQPEPPVFNIAVWIVELTPAKLGDIEGALGFSLDPACGRCVLTADEHASLLAAEGADGGAVERKRDSHGEGPGNGAGRIVGSGSVSFLPGGTPEFSAVKTVRVPYRYEARLDPADGPARPRAVPAAFDEQEVGLMLRITSSGEPRAGALPIRLDLDVSRIAGWQSLAEGTTEPVIKTWHLTTALSVPLGKTVVLVNRPHEPFASSTLFRSPEPEPPTVALLLIRAEGTRP